MKRKFIEIDEEKCNGCGKCVVACAEGALRIVNGKAKVISESFCDGLGACIGHCPQDALKIVEKDVAAFDEKAVAEHLNEDKQKNNCTTFKCPGMAIHDFDDKNKKNAASDVNVDSQLRQWPIQLHLVNPDAPYFKKANFLIAASCTAFSFGNFHNNLLENHTLTIACPKLDRTEGYIEKLTEIIKNNNLSSITVARMEVPCCMGLTMMVKSAIEKAGINLFLNEKIISIKGEIIN